MRFVLLIVMCCMISPLHALSTSFLQNISNPGPNGTPQIAVAANGKAMAVWGNLFGQANIQAAYFNGTSWIGPFTVAAGSNPKVGIDQNGNAFIVWVGPMNQIFAAYYQPNAANTTINLINQTLLASSASSPTLAVSPQGIAVVVWIQTPYQILASSFNPTLGTTGTWGSPVIFMPTTISSVGTYPASFGLSNLIPGSSGGLAVWLNGPTGLIQTGRIFIP